MGPKTRHTARVQTHLGLFNSYTESTLQSKTAVQETRQTEIHGEESMQRQIVTKKSKKQENKKTVQESKQKQIIKTKSKKERKERKVLTSDVSSAIVTVKSTAWQDELVPISELLDESCNMDSCSDDCELLGFESDKSTSPVLYQLMQKIEELEKEVAHAERQCDTADSLCTIENTEGNFLPFFEETLPCEVRPVPKPCIVSVEIPISGVPEVITLDSPEVEDCAALLSEDKEQSCADNMGETLYMEQLHAAMKQSPSLHSINVVVTGPPGVGKTKLVLDYLQQRQITVFWLDASCDTTLDHDVCELASHLEISVGACSTSVLMNKVYAKWSMHSDVVLVLDNVDKPQCVSHILPCTDIKPASLRIIVMSQYTKWACDVMLPLRGLTSKQSLKLLRSSLPDTADLDVLVKLSGNLPCALQGMLSYFNHKNKILQLSHKAFTVDDFMAELDTNPHAFFDFRSSILRSLWQASLDKLEENSVLENALFVLNLLSFVVADDIHVSMFAHVYKVEHEYLAALLVLKENSLIWHKGEYVSLIPIFKRFMQSRCPMLEQVVQVVLYTCTLDKYIANVTEQVMHTWQYVNKFPHLITSYSKLFTQIVTSNTVSTHDKLQFTERHIATLKHVLSWEHEDFLYIQTERAYMQFQMQQFAQCSQLCTKILNLEISRFKDNYYYFIVTLKCKCLESLDELEELFEFTTGHYHNILEINGAGDNKAHGLLRNICSVAFKLYHKHKSEQWTSTLFKLVQARAKCKETNFEHTLQITQDIAQCLIKCKLGRKSLVVFDRLYTGCINMSKTELALRTLYHKALCLYDMKEVLQSWKLLSHVYEQQTHANLDTTSTLLKMCEVACMLDSQILSTFLSLLTTRVSDDTQEFKTLLELVQNVASTLARAGKICEVIGVFDTLHATMLKQHGMSSHQSVLTLFFKAQFLCENHALSQAWEVITVILQTQCNPVVQRPSTQHEMQALLSHIRASCV